MGCAYEWGGQAAFWGPIAGVAEAECDALVTGAECRLLELTNGR